jgi:Ser/Thr protein kinase RdoA (MazF antagonist)
MRGNQLFVHRFTNDLIDAWVVFYNSVKIKKRLPRRLEEAHIVKLGREFAHFHKICDQIKNPLPKSTKTLRSDLHHLRAILDTEMGRFMHGAHESIIREQIDRFLEQQEQLDALNFSKIPVFVDWNIGNFSVTNAGKLYTRWDYDWFRMSSRMMDFYFLSRIVSEVGDRTVFTYNVDTMMEERFILFLKEYHAIYPLSENEIRFLKEAYRFFILNYVIKDGRYFFHEIYASKLQKEAYESYFPRIDKDFDAEKLLKALDI